MRSRLRPGETLVLVARRHKVALLVPALVVAAFAALFAASFFVTRREWRLGAGAALTAALAWGAGRWAGWRADLWAVTSERVIDESGVMAVRAIDSPLDTIHNVACEQTLAGRILGYGRIVIQTAAEHGQVTIDGVERPEAIRDAILDRIQARQRGRSGA